MRSVFVTANLISIGPSVLELGIEAHPEMSLLHHCVRCEDSCCKGRTLVRRDEMEHILVANHRDHFSRWSENIYFLDRGPCAYLRGGLCSVQAVKPFVCEVFPFVPR